MQHVSNLCLQTWCPQKSQMCIEMDRSNRKDRNPVVCRAFIYSINHMYIWLKCIRLNPFNTYLCWSLTLAIQNRVRQDFSPCEEIWGDDNSFATLAGNKQLIARTINWFYYFFFLIILLWMPDCGLMSRYTEINAIISLCTRIYSYQHWEWIEKQKRKGKKSCCNEINRANHDLPRSWAPHNAPHGKLGAEAAHQISTYPKPKRMI